MGLTLGAPQPHLWPRRRRWLTSSLYTNKVWQAWVMVLDSNSLHLPPQPSPPGKTTSSWSSGVIQALIRNYVGFLWSINHFTSIGNWLKSRCLPLHLASYTYQGVVRTSLGGPQMVSSCLYILIFRIPSIGLESSRRTWLPDTLSILTPPFPRNYKECTPLVGSSRMGHPLTG